MKDQHFDDLVRRIGRAKSVSTNRRSILKYAAVGSAVTAGAGLLPACYSNADQVGAQGTHKRRDAGKPDIAKIAFDLDYDVDKIFRFVADEIRYEPYSGILRGPIGTLWGMSGNSIDQALLLADLLKEALIETRIVVGEINEEISTRLLDSANLDADSILAEHRKIAGAEALAAVIKDAPAPSTAQATEAEMIDFGQRATDSRPLMLEATRVQLGNFTELIGSQLSDAGIFLDDLAVEIPQRELARHAWVQIAQGTEWFDLDPSVPEAEYGTVYGDHGVPLESVDDAEYHQITVRVIGDMVRGGTVIQEELLTYTGRSADLVGTPISLLHAKPQWMGDAINEALGGTDQYQPFLQVGTELTQGTKFAFGGQGGILDALGDSESTREGEPVAEWLEITITGPDSETLTEVRSIFDRVGDEARESNTVAEVIAELPPIETVALDEQSGDTFLPLLGATNISVVSAPVPVRYFAQDWTITDTAGDLAYQNHSYHFLRDMLGAELAAETGLRFIRNRPAVTLLDIGVEIKEDTQIFKLALDLLQPSHMAAPVRDANVLPNAGVVEGVLNQVCERNLFEISSQVVPGALSGTFSNVGVLFEAAAEQQIPVQTIAAGGSLPDATAQAISASARVRITGLLAEGYAIVVPERPVVLHGTPITGWWAIDPTSGRTIDRFENGRGPEMAKEATLLDIVLEVVHHAYILSSCVISVAVAAACIIALVAGVGGDGAVAGAVAGAGHGFAMCAAAIA